MAYYGILELLHGNVPLWLEGCDGVGYSWIAGGNVKIFQTHREAWHQCEKIKKDYADFGGRVDGFFVVQLPEGR